MFNFGQGQGQTCDELEQQYRARPLNHLFGFVHFCFINNPGDCSLL